MFDLPHRIDYSIFLNPGKKISSKLCKTTVTNLTAVAHQNLGISHAAARRARARRRAPRRPARRACRASSHLVLSSGAVTISRELKVTVIARPGHGRRAERRPRGARRGALAEPRVKPVRRDWGVNRCILKSCKGGRKAGWARKSRVADCRS